MIKYIGIALLAINFSSCGDFLEEYSTDQRYCEQVQDIEDLMIGNAFMEFTHILVYGIETMSTSNLETNTGYNYPWLHVMDDDVSAFAMGDDTQMDYTTNAMKKVASALNMLGNIHYWKQEAYTSVENVVYDDYQWQKVYAHIGALNSIIYNAENDVKPRNDAEATQLKHLTGEAYFLRAFYYFYLANIYGLPYCANTATSDYSVPLKISERIEDKYFTRSNNAEVWKQILADLQKAEELLKGYTPSTPKRVGYGAVEALLSRVYLYMERYDEAIKACEALEGLHYSIPDMKLMTFGTDSYLTVTSPEVIFTMGSDTKPAVFTTVQNVWKQNASGAYIQVPTVSSFLPSEDLMSLYSANDLRRNFFFFTTNGYTQVRKTSEAFAAQNNNYNQVSDIFILRYAEVELNKAEALAMTGKTAEAASIIHMLRSKRLIDTSNDVIPSEKSDLIKYIRDERRRELCFEGGHRWFDLRRYAVNSQQPLEASFTIKHKVYTYDAVSGSTFCTGHYELPFMTSKDAWTLPAPNYAIEFNRGTLTNEYRNERKFVNN